MSFKLLSYFGIFGYHLFFVSMLAGGFSLVFMLLGWGYYLDFEFFSSAVGYYSACLIVDWMSLVFSCFVMFISACVMLYSEDYMLEDSFSKRFVFLVFLFVISMLLMINSPNLLSLLVGWDGLGLVSYLLVIHYQNVRSYGAGMLTLMFNRIGDAALLMSICWCLAYCDWQFDYMYGKGMSVVWVISGFCLFAGMTSSAQIPFSAWLPAAMAAPTPVSALVHSSTLVTAGVYLLIRLGGLKVVCLEGAQVLLVISVLTMFMAGVGANYEYDLSKIVALSTLSQLGLMMFILSMGYEKLALFHLLSHAMFSACLFLCAGSVIHSSGDDQDVRSSGGMILSCPYVALIMLVCNFALMGFPFMSGFYSKDTMIEVYMMGGLGNFIFLGLIMSVGLTACYSMRLAYYLLFGSVSSGAYMVGGDSGRMMVVPMLMLGLMGVVSGGGMMWLLFPIPSFIMLGGEMKMFVLVSLFLGLVVGISVWWGGKMKIGEGLSFVGSMWFLSDFSGQFLYKSMMLISGDFKRMGDTGWVEVFSGGGVYKFMLEGGMVSQFWQNNTFKAYMYLGFLLGLLGFF